MRRVSIRLPEEQLLVIDELATMTGLKRSEFIRHLITMGLLNIVCGRIERRLKDVGDNVSTN